MESSINQHQRNLASIMHISTFSKYFFPFGNFIIPLILWTTNKNESDFVDHNGKQAINFQISILLYGISIGLIMFITAIFTSWHFYDLNFINFIEYNEHHINHQAIHDVDSGIYLIGAIVFGMIWLMLLVIDILCSISATIKAHKGEKYFYPFTIKFIK